MKRIKFWPTPLFLTELEAPKICDGTEQCVDWVKITFPEFDNKARKLCGSETPKPQSTSTDHIAVEFVANRITQDDGFSMFLYCVTTQIEKSTSADIRADSRVLSFDVQPGITGEIEACSKPPVPKCTDDKQ